MTGSVKRPYDSSLRQAQARQTRLRILEAAHDLFVRDGYGRTTIAGIAAAAGVSVETVYAAFRNKPTVLRQVWFAHFRGDEGELTLYDRPEMQAILAEPDLGKRIVQHAAFVTANNHRMAPLLQALLGAAASEPDAARMLAEWDTRRLDVAAKYARAAAATGQLAISQEECRDILYATMDGTLWQRLVAERGWSDDRYAQWLATAWHLQFLENPAKPTR